MPLYEFILRVPGRPDEVRISDSNGLGEGDAITIAGRAWTVVAREPTTTERPDRVPVAERIVLARRAVASDRGLAERRATAPTGRGDRRPPGRTEEPHRATPV